MSKGMFIPLKGVRISENKMTPSGLKAFQGCRETSTYTIIAEVLSMLCLAHHWTALKDRHCSGLPNRDFDDEDDSL